MRRSSENKKRSLVKSLTFRSAIIVTDTLVFYLLTQSIDFTISLVALRNIFATGIYFFHERWWSYILWGKS